MDNSNNIRLLNRVFETFKKFRLKQINANGMVGNISGNLTALEGVDNDFIDNVYGFMGEIEFIQFTENNNVIRTLILKKVNEYEDYLRKYFKEALESEENKMSSL